MMREAGKTNKLYPKNHCREKRGTLKLGVTKKQYGNNHDSLVPVCHCQYSCQHYHN